MSGPISGIRPRLLWLCCAALLHGVAFAENVDPLGNGSQYAWGENLGWLNAEPQGNGGPGIQVGDSAVTGWIWAENAGWISLSCQNTGSCGANSYGVVNDGKGDLSGFAWGENIGWVDFLGVQIHGFTGIFSGKAWAENAGWINFGNAGPPAATQIKTGWQCPDPDADGVCSASDSCPTHSNPNQATALFGQTVTAVNKTTFVWPTPSAYQIRSGNFSSPASIGTFTVTVSANGSAASYTDPRANPASGFGYWYLFRPDCTVGSYSTGSPKEKLPGRDAALIP